MNVENRPICQVCGEPIEGRPWYHDDKKGAVKTGGDPLLTLHPRLPCASKTATGGDLCNFLNRNAAYFAGRGEPVLFDGTSEGRRRVARAVRAANRSIERYVARMHAQAEADWKARGYDKILAEQRREAARTA